MILIEVYKGIVSDVYADNPGIDRIVVVDIDGARVGDVNLVTEVNTRTMVEAKKEFAHRVQSGEIKKKVFYEIFKEHLE